MRALLPLLLVGLMQARLPAAGETHWVGARPPWLASHAGLLDGPVHATLVQALAAARDGDRIVVPEGEHKGPLAVATSVALQGLGRGRLPRLLAPLVITADDVSVDRFELAAGAEAALTLSWANRVSVSRCVLRGAAEGLHITDSDAVRLVENRFERVNRALLLRGSGGLVADNLVQDAGQYAIELEASEVDVLRNTVIRAAWAGVIVHSGGRGTFAGNVLEGGDIGFSIQSNGNEVRDNVVRGALRGLLIGVSPRGVDPKSRHATAFLDALEGETRVTPQQNQVTGNLFDGCVREGLLLRGARQNTIRDNHFRGGLHGLVLMAGADGNQVLDNRFEDNLRAAVAVIDSRQNTLADVPSLRLVNADDNDLQRCGPVSTGSAGFDLPEPTSAPLSSDRLLVFGDLHTHSVLSDGCTSPEEIFSYGRDVLGLSFTGLSDHGEVLSRHDWRWPALNRACIEQALPGRFLTVPGYEVTWPVFWDGHYNVYFPHDQGTLHRAPYDEYTSLCDTSSFTPARLLAALRAEDQGALVIRHHFGPTPEYWRDAPDDPELVPLTEISSVHGVFEGDPATDRNANDRRHEDLGHAASVLQGLAAGRVFGLVGSSDSHYGFPGDRGLMGVMVERLDTESLFAALRARHTYATTGAQIRLGFTVNGAPMGSVLPATESVTVLVEVLGTAALDEIVLLADEDIVAQGSIDDRRGMLQFREESPPAGRRYRVRVRQVDGELAWSSPVWIAPPPPVPMDAARALDRERMSLLVYAASLRAWHKLALGALGGLTPQAALEDPDQRAQVVALFAEWVASAEAMNRLGAELGLTDRAEAKAIVKRWNGRWGGQLPATTSAVAPLVDLADMAARLGLPVP